MDHAVDLFMPLFESLDPLTEVIHRRCPLTLVIGAAHDQVSQADCESLVLGNEVADLAVLASADRSGEPAGEDEAAVQGHSLGFEVTDQLRNW